MLKKKNSVSPRHAVVFKCYTFVDDKFIIISSIDGYTKIMIYVAEGIIYFVSL